MGAARTRRRLPAARARVTATTARRGLVAAVALAAGKAPAQLKRASLLCAARLVMTIAMTMCLTNAPMARRFASPHGRPVPARPLLLRRRHLRHRRRPRRVPVVRTPPPCVAVTVLPPSFRGMLIATLPMALPLAATRFRAIFGSVYAMSAVATGAVSVRVATSGCRSVRVSPRLVVRSAGLVLLRDLGPWLHS